jgi:hypothetical protein
MPEGAEGSLKPLQVATLAAYGVALWFIAALAIRYGTPAGVFGPRANVPVYAATAVGCFGLIWAASRLGPLGRAHLLPVITWISLAALLCDGWAIAWWPGLYGAAPEQLLPGIAWLSFAVGICLFWALILPRRR